MSKRILLFVMLVVSHSAVAGLTFIVTCNWLQHTSQDGTNKAIDNKSAQEVKLDRFVKEMKSYTGGNDAEVRAEVLLAVQASEQLEPADRQLVIGLNRENIANYQLLEIQCVRAFLDSYSNPQSMNIFAFTSEKYRPLLLRLLGDPNSTPGQVLTAKKQIHELANSFVALRKKALALPYTEVDNRLHFLEMLRDLTSENYSDAKITSEPKFPLLNDRDGLILASVEKWVNSSHARKAFPIEQFDRLYRDGEVQLYTSVFPSYLDRIKARLNEEQTIAKESQGGAADKLTETYSAIETFLTTLTQLTRPPS